MCFFFKRCRKMIKKLWQNDNEYTIIKNCDKNTFFRFRLATEGINYLL
jgi:hypothetical protein